MAPLILFQVAELCLCLVLFIIWEVMGTYSEYPEFIIGIIFGFLIICSVLLLLEIVLFEPNTLFVATGCILFFVAGVAVLVDQFGDNVNWITSGSLCLVNGVVFLVHVILLLR